MELRSTESMGEMGEKMGAELRAELHSTEVQLSHWVAEREHRLGDIQASTLREDLAEYCLCGVAIDGACVGESRSLVFCSL